MLSYKAQKNIIYDKIRYTAIKNIAALTNINMTYKKLIIEHDIDNNNIGSFIIQSLIDCMEKIITIIDSNNYIDEHNISIEVYAKIAVKIANHFVYKIQWSNSSVVNLAFEIKNKTWFIFENIQRLKYSNII